VQKTALSALENDKRFPLPHRSGDWLFAWKIMAGCSAVSMGGEAIRFIG
jgi:hypothetical protein